MPDKKLTDTEIIKALENEIRLTEYVDSSYCDGVELSLVKDTLDLINRQKAEIERLKTETRFSMTLPELEACEAYAKAEAIKEFAERLKKMCDAPHWCVWLSDIDNLLEEMVGEDK